MDMILNLLIALPIVAVSSTLGIMLVAQTISNLSKDEITAYIVSASFLVVPFLLTALVYAS